jgi:hypothetical protein
MSPADLEKFRKAARDFETQEFMKSNSYTTYMSSISKQIQMITSSIDLIYQVNNRREGRGRILSDLRKLDPT